MDSDTEENILKDYKQISWPSANSHTGRVLRNGLGKSKMRALVKEGQAGHNRHFAACGALCDSSEEDRGHFPGWPGEVLPAAKHHEITSIACADGLLTAI